MFDRRRSGLESPGSQPLRAEVVRLFEQVGGAGAQLIFRPNNHPTLFENPARQILGRVFEKPVDKPARFAYNRRRCILLFRRLAGAADVKSGPVVQLVRTLACHARGRRFEPFRVAICCYSSVGRALPW